MSSDFITNKEKFLDDVLNAIIPSSKKLHFLVGYFYFSGFDLIQSKIKDKNIKILVGMDIDTNFKNRVIEYNFITEDDSFVPNEKIKKSVCNNLVESYQKDELDTKENTESFKVFVEKLKNGTLEVKKTKEPNHAKVYIFERGEDNNEGGTLRGAVITGSSNFTFSGLRNRNEVNVISRNSNDFTTMKEYFDNLWNNESIPIFNKDNYDFFYNEVERKIPSLLIPSPYLLYTKAIYEYFNIKTSDIKYPSDITDERFVDFKYQTDAIKKAIDIIKRHNGVIIADVVGLGKSIIASAVAFNLKLSVIIIAPPHLQTQWEEYRREFDLNAIVYSSGMIDKANEDFRDIFKEKLIIVDEAHKYRNEVSSTYGELWKLCQGNKVVLLTATPFNNKPEDVFSMIKLFQIPSKSTLHNIDNLYLRLKEIVIDYEILKKENKNKKIDDNSLKNRIDDISKQIRTIIEPLVIRRTRIDLEKISEYKNDLDSQGISFPKVNDPILLEYNLGNHSKLYIDTLKALVNEEDENKKTKELNCVSYKPLLYIKNLSKYKDRIKEIFGDIELFKESQRHIAIFIKRLLVRRYESSVFAFKESLSNIKGYMENIKRYADKYKFVPIFKKKGKMNVLKIEEDLFDFFMEDEEISLFYKNDMEESIEEMKKKGMIDIKIEDIEPEFLEKLDEDIQLLEDIRKSWFPNDKIKNDPKLDSLRVILKEMMKNDKDRKIIIFSEFSDTVNYLYEELNKEPELRIFKYTSKDANETNKETIRKNFDASNKYQVNYFDILIATDAISEGYNLNRAGTIINYDIPYNPTRVIQRIGRINRVNKKVFEELFVYNFFPTEIGESEINTKKISTLKISLIQAIFGGDTKALTKDEELKEYLVRQFRENIDEEESWDVGYKNLLNSIKIKTPDLIKEIENLPSRIRIRRVGRGDNALLLFAKKGDELVFKLYDNEIKTLDFETGIKLMESDVSEKGLEVTDKFYDKYNELKKRIFIKKTKIAKDKGIQETLDKLEILKQKNKKNSSYFNDIATITKDYDGLPDYFAKYIRNMGVDEKAVIGLIEVLPESVIKKMESVINSIDNLKETIIITEELEK